MNAPRVETGVIMDSFNDKLAVITGAGSGMGRDLALQLSEEGCHVALSDITADRAEETRSMCVEAAPADTLVSAHGCDVSDEDEVNSWRDNVLADHDTDHVNLVFNNAGIGGGGSFIVDERADGERTFAVCWYGVYYCTRAFMTLLVASESGHLVNTSSVNGFWASLGPQRAHTAYSAAKFAVKGFTEALISDLRLNAPHVKVSVVMPGHIGTNIALHSTEILGHVVDASITERSAQFRNTAPTTSPEAATVILDAVRAGKWRILIGDDAYALDSLVRDHPEEAYDEDFRDKMMEQRALNTLVGEGLFEP